MHVSPEEVEEFTGSVGGLPPRDVSEEEARVEGGRAQEAHHKVEARHVEGVLGGGGGGGADVARATIRAALCRRDIVQFGRSQQVLLPCGILLVVHDVAWVDHGPLVHVRDSALDKVAVALDGIRLEEGTGGLNEGIGDGRGQQELAVLVPWLMNGGNHGVRMRREQCRRLGDEQREDVASHYHVDVKVQRVRGRGREHFRQVVAHEVARGAEVALAQ